MHAPLEAVIGVYWVVLCTPVVPHGHRSHRPLKPTGKFWSRLVVKKIIKHWFAFGLSHISKAN